ncbi:MAG: DUF3379 family protein [Proteobacteria bacterium]|nr:DUF3379 family protein [Pseudomonadota bacterium]
MNCLEFRRELNIHPQSNAADFVAHARECPRCAQAQADALAFEGSLGRALAIPPPSNLAESILLAQATEQRRDRLRWRRGAGWLAVAATAVLAVGMGWRATRTQPLGDAAIAHMLGDEAPALALTAPVTDAAVRTAFTQRGVELAQVPADISYVQCCPVGKFKSVHMVMPRANGPVTVMYLVDDHDSRASDFAHAGWVGRSVPMAHGTLVLIGHDASQFDQVQHTWQVALQASTRI